MVTLIARLPFSPKCCAIAVSNIRQSLLEMTLAIPSCILRGFASQVSLRPWPTSSSLYLQGRRSSIITVIKPDPVTVKQTIPSSIFDSGWNQHNEGLGMRLLYLGRRRGNELNCTVLRRRFGNENTVPGKKVWE